MTSRGFSYTTAELAVCLCSGPTGPTGATGFTGWVGATGATGATGVPAGNRRKRRAAGCPG